MTRTRFALLSLVLTYGCASIEDEATLDDDVAGDDAETLARAQAVDLVASPADATSALQRVDALVAPSLPDLPVITDPPAFGVFSFQVDGHMVDAFGGDGIVGSHFSGFDSAQGMALGASGTSVVLGGSLFATGASSQWGFAKYLSSGALDSAFSGDGLRPLSWVSATSAVLEDLIVADGHIYAVGTITVDGFPRMGVAKLNAATGALEDSTYVTFPSSTRITGRAIEAYGSNKLIVAGIAGVTGNTRRNVALAKLNMSDLSVDATFGTSGKVLQTIGDNQEVAALDIDTSFNPDRIVLGGSADFNNASEMWVTRYESDGDPDNTFDGNGIKRINFGGANDRLNDLAVSSGQITVVGSSKLATENSRMAIARLDANGSLDGLCGNGGGIELSFAGNNASAQAVTVGNAIRVAGTVGTDVGVAQLHLLNCSLDDSFDGNGSRVLNVTSFDQGNAIMTSNGRIYVGGRR